MSENANYCKAYRDRLAKEAERLGVMPVTLQLSKGIRAKLLALCKATGMGRDEAVSTMILAAEGNPALLAPPRTEFVPTAAQLEAVQNG